MVETSVNEQGTWKRQSGVVAELIPSDHMRLCFLDRKMTVLAGQAALWISNGKAIKIVEQGQIRDDMWNRLKRTVGAGNDLQILMVDSGDISLEMRCGLDRKTIEARDPAFFLALERQYFYHSNAITPQRYDSESYENEQRDRSEKAEKQEQKATEYEHKQNEVVETREKMKRAVNFGFTPIFTSDRDSIVLDVSVHVSFILEDAPEILKLLKSSTQLLKSELCIFIQEELEPRVLATEFSKYTSAELRINPMVISALEKTAREELDGWLSRFGIRINRLSINLAITEHEIIKLQEKEKDALEEAARAQHERNKAASLRSYEEAQLREELASKLEMANRKNEKDILDIDRAILIAKEEKKLTESEYDEKIKMMREGNRIELLRLEQEVKLSGLIREAEIEIRKRGQEISAEQGRAQQKSDIEIAQLNALVEAQKTLMKEKTNNVLAIDQHRYIQIQHHDDHTLALIKSLQESQALTGDVATEIVRQATLRHALEHGAGSTAAVGYAEGQARGGDAFREGLLAGHIAVAVDGRAVVQTSTLGSPRVAAPLPAPPPLPRLMGSGAAVRCPNSACGMIAEPGARYCSACATALGS